MKTLLILALAIFLGCTQKVGLNEFEEKAVQDEFIVAANYRCLYYHGADLASQGSEVERWISSTEPFSFYLNDEKKEAYLRQPHTLIKIKSLGDNESLITRKTVMHTPNPDADDLIRLLKSNPCKP